MDQLMSDFSPPRVSTSFERKVGASLCKASELTMSDKLPKFRLVSAPTGGSKTTSSIALLAMLANEDKGFTGAYIFVKPWKNVNMSIDDLRNLWIQVY